MHRLPRRLARHHLVERYSGKEEPPVPRVRLRYVFHLIRRAFGLGVRLAFVMVWYLERDRAGVRIRLKWLGGQGD